MAKLRASLPLFLAVVALLIAAAATYGVANSQSANGKYDADADGLIEVSNLEQLNAIRYDLDGDGQADAESNRDAHAAAFPGSGSETVCVANCNGYELARSLDFDDPGSYASGSVKTNWTSGDGWLPIGNENNRSGASFNGNGHIIANLYINRTTSFSDPGAVGLFGYVRGQINNLGLVDVDIKGVDRVGGLVGDNSDSTIRDSYVIGSVSGKAEVGGLAGRSGAISNSYAAGSVSGESTVGGLAGQAGRISSSYATSSVSGHSSVGGLVGQVSRISDSYATGTVSGTGEGLQVGGLAGWADEILISYATGTVSGESIVGGLAGGADTIRSSYATGSVLGHSGVVGLVGARIGDVDTINGAIISDSYATGSVSGHFGVGGLAVWADRISNSYANGSVSGHSGVGGLAGSAATIRSSYATGSVSGHSGVGGLAVSAETILASYATGKVTGTGENVGGLVGLSRDGDTVIGGYWDTQTSSQATSAAGEGKTTAELQSPISYTSVYAAWRIDLDNADQDFDRSTGVDDFWDFGTSGQYPALKADVNGDGVATWQEFGNQRPQSPAPTARPTLASTPTVGAGAADSNARPSAEVFGELVQAGLLVSVWRYHNATQSWDAYFPSVPAELNDLTHAAPKDIVWVEVTETTQFQGRTLRKGWNLISLK